MCDELALCEPFSDPEVVEWAQGRSTHPPVFADPTQKQATAAMRNNLLLELEANRNTEELMRFPEWTWSMGITHERPRFGDLWSSDLAHERRKSVIESLLHQGHLEALRKFPEYQKVLSTLYISEDRDLEVLLKALPRPRRLPNNQQERRLYRRWLGQWDGEYKGCYRYFLRQLQNATDEGRLAVEPKCKNMETSEDHRFTPTSLSRLRVKTDHGQRWRKPDEQLIAWMQGRYHGERPQVRDFALMWPEKTGRKKRVQSASFKVHHAEAIRHQSFINACRNGDPDLAVWPEFESWLTRLRLRRWHEQSTINTVVAGLLIAQQNYKVGLWLRAAERMEKKGKDPLTKSGYRNAMKQLYAAIFEGRRLVQRRHDEQRSFEHVAHRATIL